MADKQVAVATTDTLATFKKLVDRGDGNHADVVHEGGTGYPVGSTAVHSASANGAATAVTATLAAVAGKTNYLSGFRVTGGGATAASLVEVTVTGLLGGTATYILGVVAGATAANQPLNMCFDPPIPASAANVAIVVTVPSLGAGNTKSTVSAHGFYL